MILQPQIDLNRAVLRGIGIFQDLPDRALDRLLGSFALLMYPKGYKVLRQDTASNNALYLIRSGQVRVTLRTRHGEQRILALFGRGEIFGEMEILGGGPVTATVETILDSEFWVLSRDDFNAVLEDYPQMAVRLAVMLSQRLSEVNRLSFLRPTNHLLSVAGAGSVEDTSFLAFNLAAMLRVQTRATVMLLDMDCAPGPLEPILGFRPVTDPSQVISSEPYLHTDAIARATLRTMHGFSVLGLKPAPEHRDRTHTGLIPRLLSYLRESYTYVVVNLGQVPDRLALKALEQCDLVLKLDSGRWPDPPPNEGRATVVRVSLSPRDERSACDARVHLHGATREAFLASGQPLVECAPLSSEMAEMAKLSRQARNALIGVALGSGTALGWTHVGVLKVLERERIPIDMISGSSMGAFIGGLLAMGMPVSDICEIAQVVDRNLVNSLMDYNWPIPRDGLIRGVEVESFLRNIFADTRFEDLAIPFAAVATDVVTGEKVVLRKGLVAKAIRASSSIPGVFRMAELEGRFLLDGGVYEPVPVSTLREAGVQRVIAVNCSQAPMTNAAYLERKPSRFNVIDIILRATEILLHLRGGSRDCQGDVTINPRVERISWRELWRAQELIEAGERAAEEHVPDLRRLLVED